MSNNSFKENTYKSVKLFLFTQKKHYSRYLQIVLESGGHKGMCTSVKAFQKNFEIIIHLNLYISKILKTK